MHLHHFSFHALAFAIGALFLSIVYVLSSRLNLLHLDPHVQPAHLSSWQQAAEALRSPIVRYDYGDKSIAVRVTERRPQCRLVRDLMKECPPDLLGRDSEDLARNLKCAGVGNSALRNRMTSAQA
jgi:hypothetical protein